MAPRHIGAPRATWVAGNWKLNKTLPEALALAGDIASGWRPQWKCRGLVAPVFTALAAVSHRLQGSGIAVAAQNLYPAAAGAFTGEVSGPHLRAAGCSHVLVGHSERRSLFGETPRDVGARLRAAIAHGLSPLLCVGESLEERRAGRTLEVICGQVDAALAGEAGGPDSPRPHPPAAAVGMLLAYEPVWAIGTGEVATPAMAQEAHAGLRAHLAARHGAAFAAGLPMLYGGSVKPDSAHALCAEADIDGLLVGGAALTAPSFLAIAAAADAAAAARAP